MQLVSSRIWTRVSVSISYDDNHYTTGTSQIYGYAYILNIHNLVLSLIGIILRLGFLIWELLFIYCGLFVLILVFFCVVSSFGWNVVKEETTKKQKNKTKQKKPYQDEDKKSSINKN